MFEKFWKTIYNFFFWFKSHQSTNHNDADIEYGELPDNINTNYNYTKLTINIPKYEFVLIDD